jgi:hypothetical protein
MTQGFYFEIFVLEKHSEIYAQAQRYKDAHCSCVIV